MVQLYEYVLDVLVIIGEAGEIKEVSFFCCPAKIMTEIKERIAINKRESQILFLSIQNRSIEKKTSSF